MKVHCLQHAEHEGLGSIAPWLAARGVPVTMTRLQRGEPLPPVDEVEWLVVLGGPMNVDDHAQFPWLAAEARFIAQAIAAKKAVLGICLGAQLIARALGAAVTKNPHPELGWHPVHLLRGADQHPLLQGFPEVFTPFHWHGDTYALPPDAKGLMRSEACAQQAFAVHDLVLGIQFHLEVTAADARNWFATEQPPPAQYVQTPEEVLHDLSPFAANVQLMQQVLVNYARGLGWALG